MNDIKREETWRIVVHVVKNKSFCWLFREQMLSQEDIYSSQCITIERQSVIIDKVKDARDQNKTHIL